MKNLPIIQSLWIGEKLSNLEKLSISSFLKNGHPFHLYLYEEVEGVPHGVVIKDASKIVPYEHKDHFLTIGRVANFSDIFRYKLLLETGGYWADLDVVCLKPFQFEPDHIFASELFIREASDMGTIKVTTCVIKAPQNAQILDYCYNASIVKDPEKIYWAEIGPDLLAQAVAKFGLQDLVANYRTFCPISWWHWGILKIDQSSISGISERVEEMINSSYAIHFWNEVWRVQEEDKNADFPANSLYEKLKKCYLVL